MKNADNDFRFSLKNFSERIAIFEGNNKNTMKSKDEKKSNIQKTSSQENKKLNFDNKTNKMLNQNDATKEKVAYNINRVNNKNFDQMIIENNKLKYNEQNDKNNSKKKINPSTNGDYSINIQEENNKYTNKYTKEISSRDNNYNASQKNNPKKLNLNEIYKKMNIEQNVPNVNEEKKKELAKKEEEKNYEKKVAIPKKEDNKKNNEIKIKNENEMNNRKEVITDNKPIKKLIQNKVQIFDSSKNISSFNPEPITENTQTLYMNDEQNIFLQGKNISNSSANIYTNDKFCECFFLASFPKEKGKIIPNSESLPSDCEHDICSILPAMEPNILYKYPENIKNLEINSLAASICFPNGIKLCYEENEDKINMLKNYRSTLTNQGGQMYFIYTYHFYLKMTNVEFIKVYNMHPIKHQLTTYQNESGVVLTDELEEDIVKKLEIYSNLNFKEYVYIPYCFGLISKYPYYPQIKNSLESIFTLFKNMESDPYKIYNLITYIIKSIPIPHKNAKVTFSLPYINRICEITYPYFNDIFLFGNDPMLIFEYFSINNIISIIKLLLFEQKILVVGKDMDIISQVILNFISLLYPFEWIHTYIPVMSIKMLKFLQSFLPFFNGMNISLYKNARNILAKTEDVFIVNVDDDTIDISNNLKKNDKICRGNNYINKNLATLPKGIENLLLKEFKLIKIELEKYKNYNIFDKQVVNNKITNLFFQMFIEILYDYDKYTYIVDDYPVINTFSMINDKPKADKKFYEELTSTQLFQMFIQKSLLNEDSNFYFEEKIKEHKGQNSSEICKNIKKEFSSSQKINKNYIIKPYLIPNYIEYEEKMKSENKTITFPDIKEFIFSKTFTDTETNERKNKQIIDKLFKLNNKDDLTSYKIFLIPNNLTEKKNKKNADDKNEEKPKKRERKSTKIRIIAGKEENHYKYSYISNNNENKLSDDQKEEITDNIKEVMKKVFKSAFNDIKEEKELLMDSVKTKFGIEYFVNIISSGNKKNISIKIVENESFDFLKYIIFNVLLNILKLGENDDNLILALKLTKACLFIKTVKNKKEISLSEEIFSQLEDYSLYKNKSFWQKWIEDEMTEDEFEIYKELKKVNKANDIINNEKYKPYSNHSFEIIDKLFGIMIKLKLPSFFIYSTYSELSRKYIFDDKLFDKLIKEMIIGLEYYQKLSKK